jgi:hypothetical protein
MGRAIRRLFVGVALLAALAALGACYSDPVDLPVPDPQPERPLR